MCRALMIFISKEDAERRKELYSKCPECGSEWEKIKEEDPIIGKYLEYSVTTDAVTGATGYVVFYVPTDKIWMFNVIAVEVDATNNYVDLYADGNRIWERLVNVTTRQDIDLTTRYPRSLEAEIEIRIRVETTEAVAKTLTARTWVLEGAV